MPRGLGSVRWTLVTLGFVFFLLACSLGSIPLLSSATPTPTLTPTPIPTNTPIPTPTPSALAQTRLNLKSGDVYQVRMISDQIITQDLDGQIEETRQSIGYEFTYAVTEVGPEGNTWVDVTYDWVFIEQGGSLGMMTYDSANAPDVVPQEAVGYAALVGRGFSLQFSPRGEVLEVAGLSEMYTEIVDEIAPGDPETRELLEQMLQEQFGEEVVKSQTNDIIFQYPEGAVEVGDSWTANAESTLLVPMSFENVYTLQSFDGQIAVISVYSTVSPSGENQVLDLGFMQLGYEVEGVQEGTIQLNAVTGWTGSSTLEQHLTGVMSVFADGEEFQVPITLEATTTVTTLAN